MKHIPFLHSTFEASNVTYILYSWHLPFMAFNLGSRGGNCLGLVDRLGWHTVPNIYALVLYGQSHSSLCAKLFLCVHIQWRHNERDGVSNHQPRDCLLNLLSRRRSKETSKLRATGLCKGNSTVTDDFPAQRASNMEMFPFDDIIMQAFRPPGVNAEARKFRGNRSMPWLLITWLLASPGHQQPWHWWCRMRILKTDIKWKHVLYHPT